MATIRFLDQQNIPFSAKYGHIFNKDWTVVRYSCHITQPEINRLCEEMLIWGKETDRFRAATFLVDFDIKVTSFKRWMEEYPELREAYRLLKLMFAERMHAGIATGKYPSQAIPLVLGQLPIYDEEVAAWKKELAATKAKESGSGNTVVNVSMPKMPDTELVPQKCLGGTEIDDE